jgi:hypothetical protein
MLGRARRLLIITAAVASLVAACRANDRQVPWDTDQMIRELTADLRQFEGLASDFTETEVLGWRIDALDSRFRVEIALLWGRTGAAGAPGGWALVQGFRHPDGEGRWQRSLFYRYLKAPLTRPRPGESPDGTWHAFQRYEHAPTAQEICEFANVEFLVADTNVRHRRLTARLPRDAWLKVAGAEPHCDFER